MSWAGVGSATILVDFDCLTANGQLTLVANQNDGSGSSINWIRATFDEFWK